MLDYDYEPKVRILVRRETDLEGRTLHFITRTGRRPWIKMYEVRDVPPFEGRSAWFEVQKVRGKPDRLIGPIESE